MRKFIRRVTLFIYEKLFAKEFDIMVTVYATLIIKGYKTICQVPLTIREQVREQLRQLECDHLADITCADDPVQGGE
jgi:uncharacterized protein (UPF0297 family)